MDRILNVYQNLKAYMEYCNLIDVPFNCLFIVVRIHANNLDVLYVGLPPGKNIFSKNIKHVRKCMNKK